MSSRIRVKFVNRGLSPANALIWLRQFPGRTPVWGNCEFLLDRHERSYDWLVVDNDLPAQHGEDQSTAVEELACPPEHTLFITREPSSVSTYGTDFLNQFNHVLTGQEDWAIRHRHKIFSQPALRWYYGDTSRNGFRDLRDYDYMVSHPPSDKTRALSTVCSAKRQRHTLHRQRVLFVERLCGQLPQLDRFGEGVREIHDKADALDAYKYHIAIENHICNHWWTEKLSDAFLGMTLPFYSGAPNAGEYFPPESFVPIDLRDYAGSLNTIRAAMEGGEYERRLPAIKEARQLVLERYNTFAVVSRIVEQRHQPSAKRRAGHVIQGRHALRKNWIKAGRIAFEKTAMRVRAMVNRPGRS